jgi:hypothetical protein
VSSRTRLRRAANLGTPFSPRRKTACNNRCQSKSTSFLKNFDVDPFFGCVECNLCYFGRSSRVNRSGPRDTSDRLAQPLRRLLITSTHMLRCTSALRNHVADHDLPTDRCRCRKRYPEKSQAKEGVMRDRSRGDIVGRHCHAVIKIHLPDSDPQRRHIWLLC